MAKALLTEGKPTLFIGNTNEDRLLLERLSQTSPPIDLVVVPARGTEITPQLREGRLTVSGLTDIREELGI